MCLNIKLEQSMDFLFLVPVQVVGFKDSPKWWTLAIRKCFI